MNLIDAIASLHLSPFAIALFMGFGLVILIQIIFRIASPRRSLFRIGEPASAARAEVVDWSNGVGYVTAEGELWRAASKSRLSPGDAVRIKSVKGLTLEVTRIRT